MSDRRNIQQNCDHLYQEMIASFTSQMRGENVTSSPRLTNSFNQEDNEKRILFPLFQERILLKHSPCIFLTDVEKEMRICFANEEHLKYSHRIIYSVEKGFELGTMAFTSCYPVYPWSKEMVFFLTCHGFKII